MERKNQLESCDALVRRHDIFSDVHNIQIYCWKILLYHSLILWRLTAFLTMTSTTMMSTTMLTGGSCVWHIWWWWTNSILVVEIWKKFMLNNKSSSSTDILWWWWFWFFSCCCLRERSRRHIRKDFRLFRHDDEFSFYHKLIVYKMNEF